MRMPCTTRPLRIAANAWPSSCTSVVNSPNHCQVARGTLSAAAATRMASISVAETSIGSAGERREVKKSMSTSVTGSEAAADEQEPFDAIHRGRVARQQPRPEPALQRAQEVEVVGGDRRPVHGGSGILHLRQRGGEAIRIPGHLES